MDRLLENVISRMRAKGLLKENEEDIYRFGLECLLLEVLHYLSYIIIGFVMRMTIPLIVTAVVLIPLRRKSGGFHARTRSGCYLFSCTIVVVVCLLDKIIFPVWLCITIIFGANTIILAFAPIENENRTLDHEERKKFRKQALIVLALADIAIIISYKNNIEVCQWLLNGMMVATLLNLAGEIQTKRKGGKFL